MSPWGFLLKFLPSHWPSNWQNSYLQTANGPSTTITVTGFSQSLEGGEPTIEFTFTAADMAHTIKGTAVDLHGAAHIFLDGEQKTSHPVLKVGTAVHFPFSTTVIVHLIFVQDGERQDYRFEGKIT